MARRRTGITRQQRKNQLRVGLNNLGTYSLMLGPDDPRWGRTANKQATSQNYGDGLEVDKDGTLTATADTLKGVVKSASGTLSVDSQGNMTQALGNALEEVQGKLAVKKVPAVQDSTATTVALLLADFNSYLEEQRKAGFLKR